MMLGGPVTIIVRFYVGPAMSTERTTHYVEISPGDPDASSKMVLLAATFILEDTAIVDPTYVH